MQVHSFLRETRYSLSDGSILIATLDERQQHEKPVRDTSLSYAKLLSADGTQSRDLLALLSRALLPDQAAAKQARDAAAGQQRLADSAARGKRERERYANNAIDERWEAEHALRFSREMPNFVGEVRPGLLVTGYACRGNTAGLQLIDLAANKIVLDASAAEIERLFGGPLHHRRSREELEMLDAMRDELGDMGVDVSKLTRGTMPTHMSVLGAGHGLLVLSVGQRGLCSLRYTEQGFAQPRRFGVNGKWLAMCRGYCVFSGIEPGTADPHIYMVALDSGQIVREIPLPKDEVGFSVSAARDGSTVAFSALGGHVLILEVESGALRKIKVLHGVDRYDSPRVSISPNGRWLTAYSHENRGALVDLVDLRYANIELPEWERGQAWPNSGRSPLQRAPSLWATDEGAELLAKGQCVALTSLTFHPALAVRNPCVDAPTEAMLAAALRDEELQAIADRVRAWYRPSIRMAASRRQRGEDLGVGSSKFGGQPDLMHGAAWPSYKGRPMAFLAQVNLTDLAPFGRSGWPTSGLLSFFRALDREYPAPMFYDEEMDPRTALVLYAPYTDELERSKPPWHEAARADTFITPPCALSFTRYRNAFPELDSPRLQAAALTPEQREVYGALLLPHPEESEHASSHLFGGYPDLVQSNDLELQAERMLRGEHGPWNLASDHARKLALDGSGWVQLLQLGTCQETGWMWGDAGTLHWMIPEADLKQSRFDRVMVLGECH